MAMDERTQEAILRVLMQISQTLPSLRGDSGTGRYSIYGPNPEQNMLAHMTNAQGGGIMDTIMRMVPGLHTVDEDGNVKPIINTNFKWKDTGQSAFSHAVMDQNTRAYNAGGIAVQDAQSEAWRRAITGPGLIDEAIERFVPEEDRDVVKGIRNFIGSDMFSKVGVPAINRWLGYDRGEGVNVSMGRSFGVLAGIDRNAGGIFAAGREGSDVLNPRQMNWGDFLSGNYNEKRLNVQRTIDSAVQDLMYREDETKKGTLTKRGVVHGASDKLVTSIMADAMESGAIDEYLRSNPYDYTDAATNALAASIGPADRITDGTNTIDAAGNVWGGEYAPWVLYGSTFVWNSSVHAWTNDIYYIKYDARYKYLAYYDSTYGLIAEAAPIEENALSAELVYVEGAGEGVGALRAHAEGAERAVGIGLLVRGIPEKLHGLRVHSGFV